jgi:uncharacterized protein (TIGR03435 family)
VAELKVNKSGTLDVVADHGKNGQVTVRNLPLKFLIANAFNVRIDEVQNAPGWTETERVDLLAKAPPETPGDDLRLMLVHLLEERLKLATHIEQRVMPVYVLIPAKNGVKDLTETTPAHPYDDICHGAAAATPGERTFQCQHASMKQLADRMHLGMFGSPVQYPVVDQTGQKGSYDFQFTFTPGRAGTAIGSGTTLFEALEAQLGIKVETKKLPSPVVVVDHLEREPVEN